MFCFTEVNGESVIEFEAELICFALFGRNYFHIAKAPLEPSAVKSPHVKEQSWS